jgi:hypothetical protein
MEVETMKKGGKVKGKKKPTKGGQNQTVNVYVTKRMSAPRQPKAQPQPQQQLVPNIQSYAFARQDPGFHRLGDMRSPYTNQSYDSSEQLPNKPISLVRQLAKPLGRQLELELPSTSQLIHTKTKNPKPYRAPMGNFISFASSPLVNSTVTPQQPIYFNGDDMKHDTPSDLSDVLMKRALIHSELEDYMKKEQQKQDVRVNKELVQNELIDYVKRQNEPFEAKEEEEKEEKEVEAPKPQEDPRITRLRDELNRMQLQPKSKNKDQMGLRKYARENEIVVPKDATKAQVIDLIIKYAEENPDAFNL